MRLVQPRSVPPPAAAGPALVQSAAADSGTTAVASQTVNLSGAATVGNLLVGCGNSDATLTTPAGFTLAASAVLLQGCYLWWKIATGGETGITTSPSVSDTVAMAVLEYSGITATSPVDQTTSATGSGTTVGPISPGTTSATAQATELVVAAAGPHSFTGATAPSLPVWSGGYTGRLAGATNFATGAQNAALFVADLITASVGTQTTSVTWTNSSNDWGTVLVTFKGA